MKSTIVILIFIVSAFAQIIPIKRDIWDGVVSPDFVFIAPQFTTLSHYLEFPGSQSHDTTTVLCIGKKESNSSENTTQDLYGYYNRINAQGGWGVSLGDLYYDRASKLEEGTYFNGDSYFRKYTTRVFQGRGAIWFARTKRFPLNAASVEVGGFYRQREFESNIESDKSWLSNEDNFNIKIATLLKITTLDHVRLSAKMYNLTIDHTTLSDNNNPSSALALKGEIEYIHRLKKTIAISLTTGLQKNRSVWRGSRIETYESDTNSFFIDVQLNNKWTHGDFSLFSSTNINGGAGYIQEYLFYAKRLKVSPKIYTAHINIPLLLFWNATPYFSIFGKWEPLFSGYQYSGVDKSFFKYYVDLFETGFGCTWSPSKKFSLSCIPELSSSTFRSFALEIRYKL